MNNYPRIHYEEYYYLDIPSKTPNISPTSSQTPSLTPSLTPSPTPSLTLLKRGLF